MGMPVYVSTTANPKAKILVYAFLDSASDHSITKDLAKRLKPRQLGRKSVEVETMVGEVQKEEVNIFGDMLIKGYYGGEVALSSAYEWNEIPNSTGEFANHTNVLQQPHLSHLASKLAPQWIYQ
ncbi:hypothetical protein EB796_009220 [Bugula neritina]|uniref:Uncharacterized protein n=1 Tax=Bugula neritina TaxID=10212 RepID=A0A7J7K3F1_BUGNE|nr:hypothetical protein EB796_009220 [Bugula neritina]